jgi:SAM-dependent methyltransferase/uncharacterized protein YbaR (Trm112 family)
MDTERFVAENWFDLLGCPNCQNVLDFDSNHTEYLLCQQCGRQYAFQDKTPILLREEDIEYLTCFNQAYQRTRLKQGWRPLTAEQALKLPFGQPDGYPRMYWEVRRRSYTAFMEVLAEQGPLPTMGPVAELGAGNGWLSYNLARCGYRVVAVDSNMDEPFGLGAAKIYLSQAAFTLVQGDLDRPPLKSNKFSMVIFNASLHYARDLASALRRAERALLPKGRIVIMDSPITKIPHQGNGIGDRQFGRQELEDLLVATGLRAQWITVQGGPRWWFHQALRLVRGSHPISFPLLIAERV